VVNTGGPKCGTKLHEASTDTKKGPFLTPVIVLPWYFLT